MGMYLALWEVEESKIPLDPKERGEGWALLMSLVRQDIEKGLVKSWGAFVAEAKGYCVWEGGEVEVMVAAQQYVPYVKFKVHPVATENQVNEEIKALRG
jgi:hypothetical protein